MMGIKSWVADCAAVVGELEESSSRDESDVRHAEREDTGYVGEVGGGIGRSFFLGLHCGTPGCVLQHLSLTGNTTSRKRSRRRVKEQIRKRSLRRRRRLRQL